VSEYFPFIRKRSYQTLINNLLFVNRNKFNRKMAGQVFFNQSQLLYDK